MKIYIHVCEEYRTEKDTGMDEGYEDWDMCAGGHDQSIVDAIASSNCTNSAPMVGELTSYTVIPADIPRYHDLATCPNARGAKFNKMDRDSGCCQYSLPFERLDLDHCESNR